MELDPQETDAGSGWTDARWRRVAVGATAVAALGMAWLVASVSRNSTDVAVVAPPCGGYVPAFGQSDTRMFGDRVPAWAGTPIGGPDNAMSPRVSPEGQRLAMLAIVDGVPQLAVLTLATGERKVLTSGRGETILSLEWARDGSALYYERVSHDHPIWAGSIHRIYRVPADGGAERLVVDGAGSPQPLTDGSLIVTRGYGNELLSAFRFVPGSARFDSLDVVSDWRSYTHGFYRVAPDGKHLAWIGSPASDTMAPWGVYWMDLDNGHTTRLFADDSLSAKQPAFSPDGRWVVAHCRDDDTEALVAIATDGSGMLRNLGATQAWRFDVDRDGRIYVDSVRHTEKELRRIYPDGRITRSTMTFDRVVPLAGDRLLVSMFDSGTYRIGIDSPGVARRWLVAKGQHASLVSSMGPDHALISLYGPVPGTARRRDSTWVMAVISLTDSSIVDRFGQPMADDGPSEVAGAPDGRTMYVGRAMEIWKVSLDAWEPVRVTAGVDVAVDPDNRYLVVMRNVKDTAVLVRVPLDGQPESMIRVRPEHHLAWRSLDPNSVGRDGRIVVHLDSPWGYRAMGVLDPATGRITESPGGGAYNEYGGWAPDGSLVSIANPWRASIQRFQQSEKKAWWR